MSAFYVGQEVLTRRGKVGTVVELVDEWNVRVRFGGAAYVMPVTRLVSRRLHEKAAARSTRVPGQNR